MQTDYDVAVFGGGPAGLCAAIAAGRAGARTLLVERTGMLGGTTTVASINFPGLFHAWGKQIIAGIGWELVEQTVRESGQTLPDFTQTNVRHWRHQVRVNRFIYAALCDQAAVDAGVTLLLHAMPAAARRDGDHWQLTLCTKTGLREMTAAVAIDTTGDANVAALAGYPIDIKDERQPATLVCYADGYDVNTLDMAAITAAFEREVLAGRLHNRDVSFASDKANVGQWLRSHGQNASHTIADNARTSEGRTANELQARRSLLALVRFLRTQPGLENLFIRDIATEVGVRETATIIGQATVTVNDYTSGKRWLDAVCHSFYPIDLHAANGAGLDCRPLQPGIVPTIPRRAMLPVGGENFLVAGRCISSDRLANSALRVQASCMAMGHAAGAIAALGARQGVDVSQVPITDMHALLRHQGAIVP